jgi:hypothetical protein
LRRFPLSDVPPAPVGEPFQQAAIASAGERSLAARGWTLLVQDVNLHHDGA